MMFSDFAPKDKVSFSAAAIQFSPPPSEQNKKKYQPPHSNTQQGWKCDFKSIYSKKLNPFNPYHRFNSGREK